jgi:hypothetical protein
VQAVLSNCDALSETITRRDRLALEHVRDVRRVAGLEGGARGVELVFDGKAAPFHNKVLRRVIGPGVDEGTAIDWKEGRDLTLKVGGSGGSGLGGRPVPGGGLLAACVQTDQASRPLPSIHPKTPNPP